MSVLGIVELEPQKEFHAQTSPVMNFQHWARNGFSKKKKKKKKKNIELEIKYILYRYKILIYLA